MGRRLSLHLVASLCLGMFDSGVCRHRRSRKNKATINRFEMILNLEQPRTMDIPCRQESLRSQRDLYDDAVENYYIEYRF